MVGYDYFLLCSRSAGWLFSQSLTSLAIGGLAPIILSLMAAFAMFRNGSQLTNMYFNKDTGVITFRGFSLGYKGKGAKIYINIPHDFEHFEMDTNLENLLSRSKIFSEPPKNLADKFNRAMEKDEDIGRDAPDTIGLYIVLSGVDLSSPYGPLEGHIFMISKDDYDGMVELARRSPEFRESKFGAAFLNA